MSKRKNWYTRAIHLMVALAFLLGLAIVPGMVTAQLTLPTLDPSIDFNVKGAIHKVCIDWGDYDKALYDTDWWLVPSADFNVVVIEPSGLNPISGLPYSQTVRDKGFIDNVDCIELHAMDVGDVHIYVDILIAGTATAILEQPLHAEKKWGELRHTDLDVDEKTAMVDHTKPPVNFEPGYEGTYSETLIDWVYAWHPEWGVQLVDDAIVHWWLVEDTDANQTWVDNLMDYLASNNGSVDVDHWSACGKYQMADLDGKKPWEYINDWVCGPNEIVGDADDRAVDPNLFYWCPGGLYVPGGINIVPNTDDWYAWSSTDNGISTAKLCVNVDDLTECTTYKVMIVVLVSYPGGSNDQDDPFNGEQPVCLEKGKKEFHKGKPPVITQVKTPQLRWAGEKIVLEKDWGVYPSLTYNYTVIPDVEIRTKLTIQTYAAYYTLQEGSIGALEPVSDVAGQTIELVTEGGTVIGGTYIDMRYFGLPLGAQAVLAPLGGDYLKIFVCDMVGCSGNATAEGYSDTQAILWSQTDGEADVNAALYEITLDIEYTTPPLPPLGPLETSNFDMNGPIADHGFLVYFLEFEDVTLAEDITPWTSLSDLTPNVDKAEVAVQVRGFFDYRHSLLMATTEPEKPIDLDGDGTADKVLPAGRYILPDDWWMIAETTDVSLRPNFDLMDQANNDDIVSPLDTNLDHDEELGPYGDVPQWQDSTAYSLGDFVRATTYNQHIYECTTAGTSGATEPTWPILNGATATDNTVVWTCRAGVATTDPPAKAEYPTIGPFSTYQLWSMEDMWVAENTVPSSFPLPDGGLRNTVVPDGEINKWDAPMPPALVIFDVVSDTGTLFGLDKGNLEGYGFEWSGSDKIYQSPFYSVEIPANWQIPVGYNWMSWTRDPGHTHWYLPLEGPYEFWTDLQLKSIISDTNESPIDSSDVEVYSDNHGIAGVCIDALGDLGTVTITATADYPYIPKRGKYGPRVSDDIPVAWGAPLPEHLDADFEVSHRTGEAPLTVHFYGLRDEGTGLPWTEYGTGLYVKAVWDFDGDENPDLTVTGATNEETLATQTFTFENAGKYSPGLTVTDSSGAVDTCIKPDYIEVTGAAVPTIKWPLPDGLDEAPPYINVYEYPESAVEVTLADVDATMPAGLLIWSLDLTFYKKGWGANTLATMVPGTFYIGIVPTASIWYIPQD